MAVLIGRNTRVEVQKTLSATFAIVAISNSNPATVQYTGTGPTNAGIIVIDDELEGIVELGGQVARVTATAGSPGEFGLESIDSTSYGVFTTASTGRIVSAWSTLGTARNVNQGTATTNRLDATTLLDSKKKFVFGQSDQPEITVDGLSAPLTEALMIIEAAANTNTPLAFRLTMSDSSKRLFRGYVTLPTENIPLGDLVTMSFSITQIGNRISYAS